MNPPAGFWRRYAAYSLDAALLLLLALPLAWAWGRDRLAAVGTRYEALQWRLWEVLDEGLQRGADPMAVALGGGTDPLLRGHVLGLAADLTTLLLGFTTIVLALAAPWFIAGEASAWQASPGKRLFGLRVTTLDGARPSVGRIVGRFVAGAPSWLLLNLGHAMAGLRRDRRALHDLIAGTRVELAPGAAAAMPRGARAWLLLQLVGFLGLLGAIALRYLQLLWEVARGGLP